MDTIEKIIDVMKSGAELVHTVPNELDEQHHCSLNIGVDIDQIEKSLFDQLKLEGHIEYLGCLEEQYFIYQLKTINI